VAARNFVESLAGYSLVTYLLQIKDRHNGNIMITSTGHLIHIDFGFMLSNSPGALNTESAPFKLTQDWVNLMGGIDGPLFQHFKTLLTRGFLEVRKHCDKFLMLVEIMAMGMCALATLLAIDSLMARSSNPNRLKATVLLCRRPSHRERSA
jgi:phosphatidylinositol 4-kinase B